VCLPPAKRPESVPAISQETGECACHQPKFLNILLLSLARQNKTMSTDCGPLRETYAEKCLGSEAVRAGTGSPETDKKGLFID
jgi:hypothetical protein